MEEFVVLPEEEALWEGDDPVSIPFRGYEHQLRDEE
jgi:hypothetical protein